MSEWDTVIATLLADTPAAKSLSDYAGSCIAAFTRDKMHRLRHIPMKYYFPPEHGGDPQKFSIMQHEINTKGFIDLDADGEPCCLSDKPAVLRD